jgi:hypothetical protein
MKLTRKMKKIYILLSALIFCFSTSVPVVAQTGGQSVRYNLRVLNMKIGELNVNQQVTGDEVVVDAITDVKVKIIFTYKVRFLQHSIYRQGALWSSHLQTIKNGSVNSDTWLKKSGDGYLLVQDGDSTLIHDKITYSGSLLYFNEPVHTPVLYQEIDGEKRNMKQEGEQTYVLTDKKGHVTNTYVYKNGILDHAEIKHTLANIYMDRSTNH